MKSKEGLSEQRGSHMTRRRFASLFAAFAATGCANWRDTINNPISTGKEFVGETADVVTQFAYDQFGAEREIYEPNLQYGRSYEVRWLLCEGDQTLFRSVERSRLQGLDQREQGVYFGHIWQALSKVLPGAEKFETQFHKYWGHELYFAYRKATHKEMMEKKGMKVIKNGAGLVGGVMTDLYFASDVAVNFALELNGIDEESERARLMGMPTPISQASGDAAYEAVKRLVEEKVDDVASLVFTDKIAEEAAGIMITEMAFTSFEDMPVRYREQIANTCRQSSVVSTK